MIDNCRDDFLGLLALREAAIDALKLDLRYFTDDQHRGPKSSRTPWTRPRNSICR